MTVQRLAATGSTGLRGRAGEGAGEGNRTLMTSLEGWGSAIELRPRGGLADGATVCKAPRVAYRLRTWAGATAPVAAMALQARLSRSCAHDRDLAWGSDLVVLHVVS